MVVLPQNSLRPRTVGRLSLYLRVLKQMMENGSVHIFSRDLAKLAGVSSSQVRQDLMNVSVVGTPQNGYTAISLLLSLNRCLGVNQTTRAILLGSGFLGQSILHHFQVTRPHLEMVAVFDVNPSMVGKYLNNVPVLPISELKNRAQVTKPQMAILTVPPEVAQPLAEQIVSLGINSILNFTPMRLQLPSHVFVENNDIQTSLERVAYYAALPSEQGAEA